MTTRSNANNAAKAGCETKNFRKRTKILLGSVLAMALCGVVRYYWSAQPANADPSGRRDAATSHAAPHRAVPQDQQDSSESSAGQHDPRIPRSPPSQRWWRLNTQRITRDELAKDCLRHFGKEVLESMVNKRLIILECRQQGVKVTRDEVNGEIERMAKRFKFRSISGRSS